MKNYLVAIFLYIKETENVKNKKNFTLEELFTYTYQENSLPKFVLELPVNSAHHSKNFTIADYAIHNSRLYYRDYL